METTDKTKKSFVNLVLDHDDEEKQDGHRADIRRTWEILLRAAPATTPLGNPDTLVYLMDESLHQLFSLFRSRSTHQWLSRHPPAARSIGISCHCRLNPLINYFIAGQAALAFVAQTVPRSQHHLDDLDLTECIDELLLTFRFLAHREIQAFCEVCQYAPMNRHAARNGARHKLVCPLPRTASAEAKPGQRSPSNAAGRGNRSATALRSS